MKKLSETLTELGIAFSFPIEITDENGNHTYYEDSHGYWSRSEYDGNGNRTYLENSRGYWSRSEYDESGNRIYYETSEGYKEGTPRAEMKGSTMSDTPKTEQDIINEAVAEAKLRRKLDKRIIELMKAKNLIDAEIGQLELERGHCPFIPNWQADLQNKIDEAMKGTEE